MIDLEAVCEALADRFEAAVIGTPSGLTPIRAAYAQPPKNIPSWPAVVLEVQEGAVTVGMGWRRHEIAVDVVLALPKRLADPSRTETLRQKWLPYMLMATNGASKLGLGAASGYTVDKCLPTGWSFEEYEYGGDAHDAIRVRHTVWATEASSLVP